MKKAYMNITNAQKVKHLEAKVLHLSSKIEEFQDTYQDQAIFLDEFETLLLSHGYKMEYAP